MARNDVTFLILGMLGGVVLILISLIFYMYMPACKECGIIGTVIGFVGLFGIILGSLLRRDSVIKWSYIISIGGLAIMIGLYLELYIIYH